MTRKSNLKLRTDALARDGGSPRNVVIEFSPATANLITLRLAGRRTRYTLPIDDIYFYAARCAAEQKRRERREAKKGSKRT